MSTTLILLGLITAAIVLPPILFVVIIYYNSSKSYNQSKYKTFNATPFGTICWNKGKQGEYLTYECLKNIIGYNKFLFNIYLPDYKGSTIEVDLIIIHPTGIYVIESKNYSGWIFGNENDTYWTQSFQNGKKIKFYNPVKQNQGHIKYLQSYLYEYPPINYTSVIAFSDRCELKKIEGISAVIVKRFQVYNAINHLITERQWKLSNEKIDMLYQKLLPLTTVNEEQKHAHVSNIENKLYTCPLCGNRLTKYNGRYRDYFKCSAYPRCYYTRQQ